MVDSVAVFGGGCFWCLDTLLRQVRGVEEVVCGYAGGATEAPTYEAVCSGRTGHAEVLRISFDSARISYRELLEIFFSLHDPTTLNRQGHDVGTQYRSIIVGQDAEQRMQAEDVIGAYNRAGYWGQPIVTEVTTDARFHPGEAYHQNYFERNPDQGYCTVVIAPKLADFRKKFLLRLRS